MEGPGACINTHEIQWLLAYASRVPWLHFTASSCWRAHVLRELLGNTELLTWKHRCVCFDETPLFKLHWTKHFNFRAERGRYGRGTIHWCIWMGSEVDASWSRQELSPSCSKWAQFEGADTQQIEVQGCSLELTTLTGNPARAKWRGGNWQEIDPKETFQNTGRCGSKNIFFNVKGEIV